MSLYAAPELHAANPPSTWEVRKEAARLWQLRDQAGTVLDTFTTRKAAEQARTDGRCALLWAEEARWYAGEPVSGWRPWAEIQAGRERRAAWLASKQTGGTAR